MRAPTRRRRSRARWRARGPRSSSAAPRSPCRSPRSSRSTSTRCARWPWARSSSSASRCSPRSRFCPRCSPRSGTRVDRLRLPLPWRTTRGGKRRVLERLGAGASCAAPSSASPPAPGYARARDPVLLDADVQPRARRAADDGRGARRDRAARRRSTGPGFGAPVHVLTASRPAFARVLAGIPGVARVAPPVASQRHGSGG